MLKHRDKCSWSSSLFPFSVSGIKVLWLHEDKKYVCKNLTQYSIKASHDFNSLVP